MSLTNAIRRFVPQHLPACVLLLDNVSLLRFNCPCVSSCVKTPMNSLWKCGKLESHLVNGLVHGAGHHPSSTSRRFCTGSKGLSAGEVENARTKDILRDVKDLRQDRELCVQLFRSKLQEKCDSEWTRDDWMQLGEEIKGQMRGPWEVMCMHTLMVDSNAHVGKSLMKFLEDRPEPPGHVITTFYIGLLGKTCRRHENQELQFKKYYDSLVSDTDVLDAATIEILLEGLSYTKFYKDSVGLLKTFRLTSKPGLSLVRNVLMGALRNDDLDLCSFALERFEREVEPTSFTQKAPETIDAALATKNRASLHMIFDFMRKHRLSLQKENLQTVVESFQRYEPGQWDGVFGFVNYSSGACSVCGHQMPRLEVNRSEFKAIQSAFLDQVIVGENIFFKTSPLEVQNFVTFVNRFGPFDVVVDGMNALYARYRNRPDGNTLRDLVSHFCARGKRVLVLGSQVLRQNTRSLAKIKPQPKIYYSSTTRADDAFFLYAALHSGPDTVIVSSDKLRDHKHRLKPQLRPSFHHWLLTNQIYSFINYRTGHIQPKRLQFDLGPSIDAGGWHLPVFDEDSKHPFGRHGILCLRHGPDNFVSQKPEKSWSRTGRRGVLGAEMDWLDS